MPALKIDWLTPLLKLKTWLLIAGNSIPLFGVFYLGWDAPTLLFLYWLETAVIGFWMIVRVLRTPNLNIDTLEISTPELASKKDKRTGKGKGKYHNKAVALFFTFHAGIFMAVHLMFLNVMLPGAWNQHLGSPIRFVTDYVIPTGIWLPLAGFFVFHGVIAARNMHNREPLKHTVAEFYSRIIVMQFVVIFGGFIAMMTGGTGMLIILIGMKTVCDIYWEDISAHVVGAFGKARDRASEKAKQK